MEPDKSLVEAYNRFGLRLFKELVEKNYDRNVLFSPTSVAFSLATLYHGAGGDTRRALARVLELEGMNEEEVKQQNALLRATLEEHDSKIELVLANALWVSKSSSLDPSFLNLCKQFYKAEATSVDFNDSSTIRIINEWVQTATKGKLDRIINEDDLKQITDCILTNAIYFKGLWATPFEKEATHKGAFYLPGGKQKSVPLMSQTIECAYLQGDRFQAVSLPYRDGRLGMYIFLPAEDSSLKEFTGNLDEHNWQKYISEFQEIQVELTLPRFKSTYNYDLQEPLSKMGAGVIFTGGADFSPMGLGNHFISKIKHQVMVEVNEEGSEAAATTAVFMGRSLFGPTRVIANRPFFWAIRDNGSQTLLFAGLLVEPD